MKLLGNYLAPALLAIILLFSCKKEDIQTGPLLPTITEIEIGTNNNETGIIGRDFHFNAAVVAGYQIDLVQIKIQPRAGETYTGPWSYSIDWPEYKGVKNATVHKHFDIPTTAVEGIYDFVIIITDLNGSKLEIKKQIHIRSL